MRNSTTQRHESQVHSTLSLLPLTEFPNPRILTAAETDARRIMVARRWCGIGLMTPEEIAPRFFDHMSDHDLAAIEPLLHPSVEFHFPKTEPIVGRDRVLRFFGVLFRKYPTLTFEIQRVICEGSLAAVHWTNEGTGKTGEPYRNEGVTILEVTDGAIRFMSDFFKNTEAF